MSHSGAIPKNKSGARPKCINRKSYSSDITEKLQENLIDTNVSSSSAYNLKLKNDLTSKKNENELIIATAEVSALTNDESALPLEQRTISLSEGGVQIIRPALLKNLQDSSSLVLAFSKLILVDSSSVVFQYGSYSEATRIEQGENSSWVEKRIYINYTPPPVPEIGNFVIGATEAWIEQMEFLQEDLTWLLNLPHHRFWSQMVYCKATKTCLESYLMGGPRWFDKLTQDDACLAVIYKIHQLIFLIYVRMATYKESKINFITPSIFGDIIYENFLFDICKILDLCAMYGATNQPLLEKILNNIFTHQPKYYMDLEDLVISLQGVMKNVELKLEDTQYFLSDEASPEELADIIHYLVDTFSSLQIFLLIFKSALKTFHEKDFELKICSFYEKVIPNLIENLSSFSNSPENEIFVAPLLEKIRIIRVSILAVFREILTYVCLSVENQNNFIMDDIGKSVEKFIHILTTSAEEKVFITDYNSTYNIDEDISYFKEKDAADMTTLNFIREVVLGASSDLEFSQEVNMNQSTNDCKLKDEVCAQSDDTSGMNGYYSGGTNTVTEIELASLISNVQDLLPNLGLGFVKECLIHYNYSTEEVLNAVLEDNLPPHLAKLDRSMELPLIVESDNKIEDSEVRLTANNNKNSENDLSSVLTNRLNIYDDDEFDIWRKPAKFSQNKVYKGKKKEESEIGKDPTLDQRVKEIVREYEYNQGFSIYEDEEKYVAQQAQDYEDEYDDTYDGDVTGDVDNFGNDKKNFVAPTIRGRGALNTRGMNFMPDSSNDDSQEEENGTESQEKDSWEAQKKKEFFESNYRRTNASYNRGYRSQPFEKSGSRVYSSQRNSNPNPGQETSTERSSFDRDSKYPGGARSKTNDRDASHKVDRTTANKQNEPNSENAMSYKPSKGSGKAWRHGDGEQNEVNTRYHGGKQKEDTNHGKAQDPKFKQKMVHKNDHRRSAFQAKYRSSNF